MSPKFLTAALGLLAANLASGAEPLACSTPQGVGLDDAFKAQTTAPPPAGTIELEVGKFEADLSAAPNMTISDGVVLRSGDRLAGAENARYDPKTRSVFLDGDVRYQDPETQVKSDTAEFAYDSGRIRFTGAEFFMARNSGRGAADSLQVSRDGQLKLDGVSYTTCPPGSNDWILHARDIDLDTLQGVGTARGVKLKFQGVPILYAPYFSFPIGDARKSGILTPEIGSAGRSGNEMKVPYYWNIAPNYDATFTPRLLTDRGFQLQSEFRYLTSTLEGHIGADYLRNDKLTNDSRLMLDFGHQTLLPSQWRNQIRFEQVSDSQYFEDLGGSLSASSITHLDRYLRFDHYTDNLALLVQFEDYQTIDDAVSPDEQPYQRLPQIRALGAWPESWLGLDYRLDSELVDFRRDTGVTGWRFNMQPQVSRKFGHDGWFVTPALAMDYTRYQLSNTLNGDIDNPDRVTPIASLDAGLVLERAMKNSKLARIQTLEPRVLYVHIPYRDQSELPVFDTIMPDLNLDQLYRKNRFLGVDRLGDTDQVSIGVTSRILDIASGRELVTASVGQTRYLSDRQVTLPGDPAATGDASSYVAEVRFLLYEHFNFEFGNQWGGNATGSTQSEARFQYRPATNKVLNLSYSFRRDTLKQGDISWSWPIARQWNFVGRYNYSFRDSEALEQFFGIEYESCCWGLRVITRRHISTRDGTRDSSIGLQLVLKGMSSIGTAADDLLERGILGYSATLR